jgi:hypothetical protein
LRNQVIPFRLARRAAGGNSIVIDCGLMVASHFQKMATNSVKPMMAGNASVGVESVAKRTCRAYRLE